MLQRIIEELTGKVKKLKAQLAILQAVEVELTGLQGKLETEKEIIKEEEKPETEILPSLISGTSGQLKETPAGKKKGKRRPCKLTAAERETKRRDYARNWARKRAAERKAGKPEEKKGKKKA